MDRTLQYHVWMRLANTWEAVTKIPVSRLTAETLAVMMAQERAVPHDDVRFLVSIGRPSSVGFSTIPEPVINGVVIDKLADKAIRHAVGFMRSVNTFEPGINRFVLLQKAGLVAGNGHPTGAAQSYVKQYPRMD